LSLSVADIEQAVVTLAEVWRGKKSDSLPAPNLIGIGSGRCGTSHLYGLLRPQPDVYVTPVKEANYFGLASRRGMTLREYKTFFAGHEDERYVCDITPVYLYAPRALEEMHEQLGRIRVIATLREPVDRTVSHFKFHRSYHGFGDLGEYLRAGMTELKAKRHTNWAAPSQGVRMSLYADGIARAHELFGTENILVLLYEDLAADPEIWTRQVSDFLGVPIDGSLAGAQFRNPSSRDPVELPDDPVVDEMLALFAEDAERLAPMLPPGILDAWARPRDVAKSA
jgi:hypothetical protein